MVKEALKKWFFAGSIPKGLDPETKGLAEAYQKARPGLRHHTFCHAAEINMLFSQEGEVYVCCHNQSYAIGKYPEQSIAEIWNSEAAQLIRDKLRNYDLGGGCRICADDFKRGAFKEVRARHFDTLKPHPKYPVMMEFLLSNVCNLECVMCTGKFSSLIRKNREKLPALHTPYDGAFLHQLDEFIPHLHETRFSGSGEAFSNDINYFIWEKIIAMNRACLIMVQTNGTILSARVKEMLEKGNFQIGVSIDSLNKDTYEAIRVNANFEKVMDNLLYFREYARRKGTRFSISMCVMRQNWREVPDFIRFCNEHGAVATLHKVWHPFGNALFNLPKEELEEILQMYSQQEFSLSNPTQEENVQHFQYFTEVVKEWVQAARPEFKAEDPQVTVKAMEHLVDYRIISQKMDAYIQERYADHPSEGVRLQQQAKLRLHALAAAVQEEAVIDYMLKKMKVSPIHDIFDVVLYHDLVMLKESIFDSFQREEGLN